MKSHKLPIYGYRLAKKADASAIFDVLKEIAPEIPVRLDTPKQKELVSERIQLACVYRTVWIAELHPDNHIVGFLMAEPLGRRLNLSYGGVRADHRGKHIFPKLVKKMMVKGIPLRASIAQSNEFRMPDRLRELGFALEHRLDTEAIFLWEPEPLEQ